MSEWQIGPVRLDVQRRALCRAQQDCYLEPRVFALLEALLVADQQLLSHEQLVAQVWQNLLHNAWKYSARADVARIRVDSFDDERGRWYRVTDNGAGFDMRRARGLFQPFRRMHPSSQFEGSGVGLSLVQRIVQHHGGEVRLRSQEGVGTVAEFTLDPSG